MTESPDSKSMDTSPTRSQATESETSNHVEAVKRSDSEHEIKEKLEAMKQLADRYERQLQDERTYRQDLEKSFEKRAKELEEAINTHAQTDFDQKFAEMERSFEQQLKKIRTKFDELSVTNNQQREAFNELSNRYQRLAGHYEKTANQMRDEQITLPENAAELQFECLRLREALIESRASKEHLEEEHSSEIAVLTTELSQTQALYQSTIQQNPVERRSPENTELRQTIDDLEKRLVESQAESSAMAKSLEEYRQRCSQLQIELNSSEEVQRDFVQLSQKLQVQLEVIRQGDHELRWQFPEDITNCNECNSLLKQKVNCRHCGKVFCPACTKHTVFGGPNSRSGNVCGVCFTLLSKNSAPFYAD